MPSRSAKEQDSTGDTPKRASKYARHGAESTGYRVSWGSLDAKLLSMALSAVVDDGCAIMLGRTQDGGALALTILDAGERTRFYPATVEEAEEVLRGCLEAAAGVE